MVPPRLAEHMIREREAVEQLKKDTGYDTDDPRYPSMQDQLEANAGWDGDSIFVERGTNTTKKT